MNPPPLVGHGLSVVLPVGFDGRIYRRPAAAPGLETNPVLHFGSFPLPTPYNVGDYGNGAIELMGPNDAFVALVEFNPELAGDPLFLANTHLPHPLGPGCFAESQMQRRLAGFAGAQFFFSTSQRAFSLYAVLGNVRNATAITARLNPVFETLTIGPRTG